MARKILSFEEYSAKTSAPQIDETDMEDVAQADVEETEDEVVEEPAEEVEDSEDEVEIEDEESDDDDDDDDDEEDESDDDDELDESEDSEVVKTVSEMMSEAYETCVTEAMAYESDDYEDHTVEGYMKENAALAAALAVKAMEEAYEQVKDTEMTVEMYEANCNSMKEAYAKKIEELKEAWGK